MDERTFCNAGPKSERDATLVMLRKSFRSVLRSRKPRASPLDIDATFIHLDECGMALSAMKTHSLLVGCLPYVYRFGLFIQS